MGADLRLEVETGEMQILDVDTGAYNSVVTLTKCSSALPHITSN